MAMIENEARSGTMAYNDGMGSARVYCLVCPRPSDVDVPLTINDVEHWELCSSCGNYLVDVARAATDGTTEQRGARP
ncbi:hypothetical protein [Streptomyces nigrescens]